MAPGHQRRRATPPPPPRRRRLRRRSRRRPPTAPAAEAGREHRRVVSVLEDALEHLVRGIVDNDDDVSVELTTGRRGRTLQIRVHPDDLGKVIGRGRPDRHRAAHRDVGGRRPGHPRRRRRHRPLNAGPWTSWSAGSAGRTACAVRSPCRSAPTTRTSGSRRARVLGTDPRRARGPLTVAQHAARPGRCWCSASTASPIATPPRRLRGTSLTAGCVGVAGHRTTRTSSTTISWSGSTVVDGTGGTSARWPRSCTRRPRRCSRCTGPTAPRSWCRSSPRSCPRSTSQAGRLVVVDPPDGMFARGMRHRCGSASSRSSPATSTRCGSRCWARRSPMRSSSWPCTTCGTGPPTGTAPSTTRRTAAAPAW